MSALDNVGGPSESVAMSRDHADVVAPPPLVYVPPLAAGILLHFMWEPLSPNPPREGVGLAS